MGQMVLFFTVDIGYCDYLGIRLNGILKVRQNSHYIRHLLYFDFVDIRMATISVVHFDSL